MNIQTININQLKPATYNPRKNLKKGDLEYEKIKNSILEFGYIDPIICNSDFTIIGGHQRFKVLKDLNFNEIQCVILDLDKTREKALNIALNKISGEFDITLLKDLLQELDTGEIDLTLTGFDLSEIENMMSQFNINNEVLEDDFDISNENEIQTDIKIGDLFEIGEHRLLCGDSTDEEQVKKLMNGQKADMVFTDPPYGIKIVHGKKVGGDKAFGNVGGSNVIKAKKYSEIIGDDTTDTARKFYNTCVFLGMENFIIWGGNYFTDFLSPSMCWIIWNKENTGNFADVEMAWTSFKKGAKLYKWQWNGMIRKGDKSIEGYTRIHPTQKPVGLFGDIFNDFQFNICFDGFLGSGSTMVASHQLKRKCFGMELEPKYCQVIIDRMKKLDSTLIIKKNGIEI